VGKIIPGFTGLFLVFIILFPVPGYAQNGENPGGILRRALEDRGIPYEEGFLFSASGDDLSMWARFRRPAGIDPPGPAGSGAERSAGSPLLFIAAFSLEGPPAPEGELPYRFRTALDLIEKIRGREAAGEPLPVDMLIAFLGAGDFRTVRDYQDRSALDFVGFGDSIEDPGKTFFWYMDPGERPQSLVIHYGTSAAIAPLHIVQDLPGLCGTLDIPHTLAVPFAELYQLQLADGPELLRFLQEQEVNGLFFSGAGALVPSDPGSGKIIPEGSLAELIIRYAGSLKTPGEIPDYHYVVFPLPGKLLFLSQERIVSLFLCIAGSFLLGFLLYSVFRRPPPARIRIFFRCFWVIPAFLFLLCACFSGAGLFTALFFRKGGGTGALVYGWAAVKLLLALGIFFLFNLPLKGYRIPGKANFYGAGAFLIILLDTLIAAWADIVFIPYFTGALLVIFIGTVVKYAVPVLFCAFLAPFYGILALLFAVHSGNGALGELLLSNSPFHTLMMALIVLPFILLFKRGLKLFRIGKPLLSLRYSLIPPLLLLAAAGVLAAFLFFTR
jgi:hypothetical protein